MSGGLLVNALLRETRREIMSADADHLQKWHAEAYAKLVSQVRPLHGAVELLSLLTKANVPYAIATSGMMESARPSLEALHIGGGVPVVTRDQVMRAKPDPDPFLAAAARLGTSIFDCIVVGDSVWDLLAARRARALGVGLASGGYGHDELERAAPTRRRRLHKKFDVVYIGMARRGAGGVRSRLLKLRRSKKKGPQWSHFSVYSVWPRIPDAEIAELEGLFRHIDRRDTRANKLARQKTFGLLRATHKNDFRKWEVS